MDSLAPAPAVIAAFGGIRPLAAALGVTPSTVQYWAMTGAIPQWRRDSIVKAATKSGVTLPSNDARAA